MITINLMPEKLKENIDYSKKNRQAAKYFSVLILFGFLLAVSFITCFVFLKRTDVFYRENISDSEAVISGYNKTVQGAKNLKEKVDSIEKIKRDYKYWTGLNKIFMELSPASVYITILELEEDINVAKKAKTADSRSAKKIKITGYSKDKKTVGLFRDALEGTDEIVKADIQSVTKVPVDSENLLPNFFTIDVVLDEGAFKNNTNEQ